MIDVTLIKMGMPNREFSFENTDYPTVGSLLDRAGESVESGTITVGQTEVDEDFSLRNGDRVFISKKTKGNLPWDVVLVRMGGGANIVLPAEDGFTVNQVIDQLPEEQKAEFFSNGNPVYEYRLPNGNPIDGNTALERPIGDEMRLMLTRRTKGNEEK